MRHAQHLTLARERTQFLADDFGHRTADAGIDFVEDHGLDSVQAEGGHFDGQTDTRKLAARGDFAQRARWLSGVGGDQEFDPLARELRKAKIVRDRRPVLLLQELLIPPSRRQVRIVGHAPRRTQIGRPERRLPPQREPRILARYR